MDQLVKANRQRKIKLIEIQQAEDAVNKTVNDIANGFEMKTEWQVQMDKFLESIKKRKEGDIKINDIKKIKVIDTEIIEFSRRVRSLMQWDRYGKEQNTQLNELEIQTMMGQLNSEHDFLL